jgi:hypothetical protein
MSLSVSPRLEKQVLTELEALTLLLRRHPGLLEKCRKESPTNLELDALASMLHAFYTGVENIFKRVSLEVDGTLPTGPSWHVLLLDAMTSPSASRAAVIGAGLRKTLRGYLDFRHVFRHAYTHELKWSRMAPLVLPLEGVLQQVRGALIAFLHSQ